MNDKLKDYLTNRVIEKLNLDKEVGIDPDIVYSSIVCKGRVYISVCYRCYRRFSDDALFSRVFGNFRYHEFEKQEDGVYRLVDTCSGIYPIKEMRNTTVEYCACCLHVSNINVKYKHIPQILDELIELKQASFMYKQILTLLITRLYIANNSLFIKFAMKATSGNISASLLGL